MRRVTAEEVYGCQGSERRHSKRNAESVSLKQKRVCFNWTRISLRVNGER